MSKPISLQLDERAISKLQYATIFICFLMNILDGMDVLVISYCAPAIAKSWAIGPEALGMVFSAGLAGMALGALLLAPYADKIGRKKMILISAFLISISIYLTSFTNTVPQLIFLRFVSGLGIGSMLASTAALTAEYTPNRSKDFWVSFVLAGYPIGAVIAGYVAASVVPSSGWQMMFKLAGFASFITIPLIFLFLSESIEYYLKKQPKRALEKVNRILRKLAIQEISTLPEKRIKSLGIPVNQLLSKHYKLSTIQLWIALFFAFGCLYFLISWIPKLASNAGLSMELAIYSGTVFNVGAFFGCVIQGYISSKIGLKKTIAIFLVVTAVLMAIFSVFIGSDFVLIVFGLLGFALQGGFVGLYAVAARMYPTEFRTTGVGWAIGAGRLGGVLGPALGGVLVGMGLSMSANFMIFAVPALLAGVVTYFISSKEIS
ncbi:MFS transporter [Maribacter sp. MAR_2009_72]|uniref:MFS transporter n=1 Tax=Maribacter sp. MAR_2009_72 TaxID=1250050 RepID=UPI0011997364|nr:MFS transporter [Maribacter sp. MAR_2009_72]TVZ15981.1 benzoate transport [Maribacter sp. MAR_2009_72]